MMVLNCGVGRRLLRVPWTARRDKKAFLSDKCKEREENNRMMKTRKLEIPGQHFMKRRTNKGQKTYGPYRSRRY